jgi:hypothetical protein
MSDRKSLAPFWITLLLASVPFTVLHCLANPDDAVISPIQRFGAVVSNFFGPWGVLVVRIVDFPNAGTRAFSWPLALILTAIGVGLLLLAAQVEKKSLRSALLALWIVFLVFWFGSGLIQIASGLL